MHFFIYNVICLIKMLRCLSKCQLFIFYKQLIKIQKPTKMIIINWLKYIIGYF